MIFLTVGTTKFPFDRLLRAVDKVMVDFKKPESLIVQKGKSDYQFRYKKADVYDELPFAKILTFMNKSRVIVCHGGPATIFLALKYSKSRPLVVPRAKKFVEHVDDHEVFFAKFLEKRKDIEIILPQENLSLKVKKYLKQPRKIHQKTKIVPSKKLIEKLIDYTNEK